LHDSVPVYSWTAQGGITSYEVKLEDSAGAVTSWTFSAADASCDSSTCNVTPAHVLSPGSYTVWVRAINGVGEGPWSQPEQFYLVPSLTDKDDTWDDPNADPSGDQRRAEPSPYQEFENRIRYQTWNYDWLGNTTETDDDAKGFYDRSLGSISNGPVGGKAYQLNSADNHSSGGTKQGELAATYDVTGNLTELRVDREGTCIPTGKCSQIYRYEWDEVGRLVTARRWDFDRVDSATQPGPTEDVELHYAYDASDMRVSKRAVDTVGEESYTLYIFGSLELRRTEWRTTEQDFHLDKQTEVAYLFANGVRLARLAYEEAGAVPSIDQEKLHVFFELGDHLGSTSVVLDK
ncbi:MAG: fibronectin type III domain-containing protein, partial [Myxococcales bacterium]|nr:fibronectin type III domain-containing protein [Myxococcales bacterium]